ncbi:Fe-S oxidoreductase [Caloramator quimbayensis]|uniref:Fe-S oxidoreductase n=1 Tax=Caloramator quimbayensis TaxID=1147123 RepID=A0A1T4X087_9CLOT|nr:(Fe-S)-binding protein [Caloramator quimbayensis]SKA83063.1 Fe-S oxidoreductase [Caloramator quimbayensis]
MGKKYNMLCDDIAKDIKNKCIDCKLCMNGCPMLNEYCTSPFSLFKDISVDKPLNAEIPFSCTQCGYCFNVCPSKIPLDKIFLSLRSTLCEDNKGIPPVKGYSTIKYHQKNSFSKIFTASNSLNKKFNNLFLPGCSLSSYSPELIIKTYNYLKKVYNNDIGILLKCCGNPTHSMGQKELFNKYYSLLIKDIESMGAKNIITACPSCYNTILENSKDLKAISLWEVISQNGIKDFKKAEGIETFALHDPCPTRGCPQIHEAVRDILLNLGYKYEEFSYSKDKTLCCGSGGMIGVTNKDLFKKQVLKRASMARSKIILSYCATCVNSFALSDKKTIHILDLIFYDGKEKIKYNLKPISPLKGWKNRFKCKNLILNGLKGKED